MLTELCAELHNYFCDDSNKHLGEFKISGGIIEPSDFLKETQYYRIVGSTFNDGVHSFGQDALTDESFSGAVWAMAVPPAVVALAAEIKEYQKQVKSAEADGWGMFSAQSFGGYSGSVKEDLSWEKKFSKRLSKWRKA